MVEDRMLQSLFCRPSFVLVDLEHHLQQVNYFVVLYKLFERRHKWPVLKLVVHLLCAHGIDHLRRFAKHVYDVIE